MWFFVCFLFFLFGAKGDAFIVAESPAIRSYHQATQTLLPIHVGDTTAIGARSLWSLPLIFVLVVCAKVDNFGLLLALKLSDCNSVTMGTDLNPIAPIEVVFV